MSIGSDNASRKPVSKFRKLFQRCRKNESGMVAIEFSFVALPFFLLVFGIMQMGIIFFGIFALDNAVEQSSRLVRTGQAGAINKDDFKQQVCARVPGFMDCDAAIRVDVQSDPDLANLSPPSATNGGNFSDDGDFTYTPGSGGDYVLVTVFFKWDTLPMGNVLKIGQGGGGNLIITSTSTFRNEPF